MSASVVAANGVVVVTQVFSEEEYGRTSVKAPNVTPEALRSPPVAPVKVSEMTKAFLRGEPQSLGVVQIFIGVMCMIVSLSAILSPRLYVQAPLCGGVIFVLSGSLAVAARKGTGLGLIRATLAVNLVSVLIGLAGVAYTCFLLATRTNEDLTYCDLEEDPLSERSGRQECMNVMWQLRSLVAGIRGVMLVLSVLEVCVAVSVCVYSGKAIARRGLYSYSPASVVPESGCVAATSAPSVCDSDVALLDGTLEEPETIPPPYSP